MLFVVVVVVVVVIIILLSAALSQNLSHNFFLLFFPPPPSLFCFHNPTTGDVYTNSDAIHKANTASADQGIKGMACTANKTQHSSFSRTGRRNDDDVCTVTGKIMAEMIILPMLINPFRFKLWTAEGAGLWW